MREVKNQGETGQARPGGGGSVVTAKQSGYQRQAGAYVKITHVLRDAEDADLSRYTVRL